MSKHFCGAAAFQTFWQFHWIRPPSPPAHTLNYSQLKTENISLANTTQRPPKYEPNSNGHPKLYRISDKQHEGEKFIFYVILIIKINAFNIIILFSLFIYVFIFHICFTFWFIYFHFFFPVNTLCVFCSVSLSMYILFPK